ncbi:MAG: M1 family aminopeptidase [Bacteroidota bacterium]
MKIFLVLFMAVGICFAEDNTGPSMHRTRERSYDVRHYKLDITLNEKAKTCSGSVTITLIPLRPAFQTLYIDAAEMNIRKVTLSGKSLEFHTEGETLAISLGREYGLSDTLKVNVAYDLSSPKKGLYFVKPDSGYPGKQWQVWSQGEAEDNHFWFPCYDYPNDFATSEVIGTVNEKFTLISNGKLIDVKNNSKSRTKTYHWYESKPHASYLISVIAGEYIDVPLKLGKLAIDNYVYKDQKDKAMFSFSKTPKMIEFYSKKIGYPYPWEKFAQSVVQDFIYGGEENVSAVTLTDATIHDARAHLDNSSDGLVAHELAHMWWGDLITCRDWSNAWLNEGFATYFEILFEEYDKGRDEALKEIHDNQNMMTLVDAGNHRRATVSGYYVHPIELFDGHIYGKGACVLHMLRNYLGDELFWKSINHYARKYAFQNVETNDFKIAIEEATGYNLDWFFNEWVYKPGFPEFDVSWSWDSLAHQVTLEINQIQKIDSLTGVFTVPVDVEIWSADKPELHRITVKSLSDTFLFPAQQRPQLVLFDKGSTVLKKISTDKSTDEWLYQLEHAADAIDRSIAIDHLRGYIDTAIVVRAVTNAMLHDPFWDVRRNAAFTLSSAKLPPPIEDLINAYHDRDARVRSAVLSALGNYPENAKAQELAKSAFENDSSYGVTAAALTTLTRIDTAHAKEYCDKGLHRESFHEIIRNTAIARLAEIGGDEAFNTIKKYTEYGTDRDVRINALWTMSRVWKDKDDVITRMINLLHDPMFHVRRTVMEILGTLKNKKAIEPLRESAATESDGRLVKLAKESIEKIQN